METEEEWAFPVGEKEKQVPEGDDTFVPSKRRRTGEDDPQAAV